MKLTLAFLMLGFFCTGCGMVTGGIQDPTVLASTSCISTEVGPGYGAGSGTTAAPYKICSPAQLAYLSKSSSDWSKAFILAANIDMTAFDGSSSIASFSPIGNYNYTLTTGTPFTGVFDGNNFKISNLKITAESVDVAAGLFGYTTGATIKNVKVDSANITGYGYLGGLIGYNISSPVTSSTFQGSVTALGTTYTHVGGLIGYNLNSTVTSSSVEAAVTGSYRVGGLIGSNDGSAPGSAATVQNCSANVTVVARNAAGGLIAWMNATNGSAAVINSYALGSLAMSEHTAGGLIGYILNAGGYGPVQNSYSIMDVVIRGNWSGSLVGTINLTAGGNSNISNSRSSGTFVTFADSFGFGGYAGGIVGIATINGSNFTISNSYSTGSLTINHTSRSNLGGIVGNVTANNSSTVTLDRVYSTGSINFIGAGSSVGGGLVGGASADATSTILISESFSVSPITGTPATSGALIGQTSATGITFSSSYFSTVLSGMAQATAVGTPAGSTALTVPQFAVPASFATWNFSDVWIMGAGSPVLR